MEGMERAQAVGLEERPSACEGPLARGARLCGRHSRFLVAFDDSGREKRDHEVVK